MKKLPLLLILIIGFALQSHCQINLTLRKSFVDSIKDMATITTNLIIDIAHKQPNLPDKDGDLHSACRDGIIGLPFVSEIMNAKFQKIAVKKVHDVEGTGNTVSVTGAWRLWFEHPGHTDQSQGMDVEPATNTNPDHIFEIHPITQVGGIDVSNSLIPIDGYDCKDAADAFSKYDAKKCDVKEIGNTIIITSSMIGYNYVQFQIELLENPKETVDGYLVNCKVLDLNGSIIENNVRMVFIKNTPPGDKINNATSNAKLTVIGIPRVNLHEVDDQISQAQNGSVELSSIPYEMISVGIAE
jgi:hypothetical protein